MTNAMNATTTAHAAASGGGVTDNAARTGRTID